MPKRSATYADEAWFPVAITLEVSGGRRAGERSETAQMDVRLDRPVMARNGGEVHCAMIPTAPQKTKAFPRVRSLGTNSEARADGACLTASTDSVRSAGLTW